MTGREPGRWSWPAPPPSHSSPTANAIEMTPSHPTAAPAAVRSLFLLNSLCFGGAEKQVVALVNGLCQQNGHRVWIQCLKDDDALLPQVDPALRPQVLPNLHVRSGLEPFAVAALARRIDAHAIDVVVCTNMYALLYGSLARALCRRRNALRLVEVFHTTEVASRKERLSMTLYRRLLRATDLLVYVCRGQAAHWQAQGLRNLYGGGGDRELRVVAHRGAIAAGRHADGDRRHGGHANQDPAGLADLCLLDAGRLAGRERARIVGGKGRRREQGGRQSYGDESAHVSPQVF